MLPTDELAGPGCTWQEVPSACVVQMLQDAPRQADLLLAQALWRQLLSLVEDQTALQVQQAQ